MPNLLLSINGDAVSCMDKLLLYSVVNNVSDIHMDIQDERGYIKLRINGRLFYYAVCDHFLYLGLLGIIKSRAHLRIDVHDRGQDGSFVFFNKNKIFIRVSINPTVHGEAVVMRILNPNVNNLKTLDNLGMDSELITRIREYTDLENSLILISGATGSGKTTTMYSIMAEINPESVVIISLEEPVEKHIPNVRQVSIKNGFGYADALRVALRQDPDVIVIGEIRDRETAQIAIEAALTGHLVIAGVHGRDPVDVVYRLRNLGVDDFLISQTLSLSINQKMIYENDKMKVDFSYVDFYKVGYSKLKRHIKKGNVKTH
jgi:type II secretory ATPase GspE/PulE/Tfp pilus assembly ATPase PilB-like protein